MYQPKKTKGKIILILFVLILVGIGAYFGIQYYLKETTKQKDIKEEKPKEERKEPLTDAQVTYVLSKINFYDGMLPYGSFNQSSLNNTQALQFVDSIRDTEYVDFTRTVSLSRIQEILKRYFGEKVHFEADESTCQDENICFYYNKETKKYSKKTLTSYPYRTKNIYVSGTKGAESKTIQIQVRQLYYITPPSGENAVRYFNTVENLMANQNPLFDLSENGNEFQAAFQQAVDAHLDAIPVVTYTFVYQTAGYYLEKVEK